jgi:2-dehydro-3-deoxyphosphogalactonate aldolase
MSATPNNPALQGVIAILRGVRPDEILDVAAALVDGGVRIIEVPLNSPQPLLSIERLAARWGSEILVGAGTVMQPDEVDQVAAVGGRLVLSPHLDVDVLRRCKRLGLSGVCGVATPTEGFAGLAAGAEALKLFPAEMLGPAVLKAWKAVFPSGTAMLPVGGVGEHNLAAYKSAGAAGAGIGSSLYSPGVAPAELRRRAQALVRAWSDA